MGLQREDACVAGVEHMDGREGSGNAVEVAGGAYSTNDESDGLTA